ncbi:MAG: 5-formyltetrahydrofolate cyclo-ligase [Arcticibacterium sp.]|jgi:5-formyltetrahydrofolate cyclo-ligase
MKKAELRKKYLAKRLKLNTEHVTEQSLKIKYLLFSRFMVHRYDKVHCYLPLSMSNEVNSSIIVNTLHEDFPVSLYLPRVSEDGTLTHHLYNKDTPTELNKWGVSEPINEGVSSEEFFNTDDDILVIVPLLAFDKSGHRIGYGKGFYDRFLENATENTTITGLSLFEAEEAIEDVEETDVALHHVVTPKRVYSF